MTRRSATGYRGLYFDERSKKYYMKVSMKALDENGRMRTVRRVHVTLAEKLETSVRMMEEVRRQARLESVGLGDEFKQAKTLRSLQDVYLASLATRACPEHVAETRRALTEFITMTKCVLVRDIDQSRIAKLQKQLADRNNSARTINKKVKHVRSMLHWARKGNLIAKNPLEFVKLIPEEKAVRRVRQKLTLDERRRLCAAADAYDARKMGKYGYAIPQAPLLKAMFMTGFRLGEIVTRRWCDLQQREHGDGTTSRKVWWMTVGAKDSKAGRPRAVPIPDDLVAEIMELKARRGRVIHGLPRPTDLIFLSCRGAPISKRSGYHVLRTWLNRLLKDAKIEKRDALGHTVDLHSPRGTFATALQSAGVDLAIASTLMGHSKLDLTRKYYTDDEQLGELKRDAAAKLPSLNATDPQTGAG